MNTRMGILPTAATPDEAFARLLEVLKKGAILEPTVTTLARRVYSEEKDPAGFQGLVCRLRHEVKSTTGCIVGVESSGQGRFSLRR